MGARNVSVQYKCPDVFYFIPDYQLKLIVLFFYDAFSSFELRYAYAVASALHGVQHILRNDFMLQVWQPNC